MKLAKLNTLARLDLLFIGGEPEARYQNRRVSVEADDYDFIANDAVELSSITDWITYQGKCETKQHCIEHMQESISDWATHDSTEKDMFLEYVLYTINPMLSSAQMADMESIIPLGFTVYQNGGVNLLKTWNGSTWV